jgi:glycosyltransferase involved in cell wall biosynthesis
MKILHLTSSRFFGGPERQMLGLAQSLRDSADVSSSGPHNRKVETVFASFSETNLNRAFLNEVKKAGFVGVGLKNDTPNLLAARKEVEQLINEMNIDVLACHGYKAGLIGWWAAKNAGIPKIAVSRGWTAECWKVRLYEKLDRFMLRKMDQVVCVSNAQAEKVARSGVPISRIEVIHNSISSQRFAAKTESPLTSQACSDETHFRKHLLNLFADNKTNPQNASLIVGAAGRLSPEKGFDVLVDAAHAVARQRPDVRFVLFGDGPEQPALMKQIEALELKSQFVLAGFTDSMDKIFPNFDLFVQSSHTEGLPNVLLESLAAGVPVVATDVGGTREVLAHGKHGKLVAPDRAEDLATAILDNLDHDPERHHRTAAAKQWIAENFTFERQAAAYTRLFSSLKTRTQSRQLHSSHNGSLQFNTESST